jgi:metal-sulfur cluster biosynthetic enzyme
MLLPHDPEPLDGENHRAILKRLENVLDPELDEPIVNLGFVRSARLDAGHAVVMLQLPTSWCAVNFAFMMAEDVRAALLAIEGVNEVTVRLGDHCAAEEIEAAVNGGRSFAQAFPGECGDSLDALRRNFWRKGFLARQERLLAALRGAGWSFAAISSLRLGDLAVAGESTAARPPDGAPVAIGPADLLRRYVERRGELGLADHSDTPLIIDPDGAPLPAERLELYYRSVQTVRVSLEANGSFCRAVLATRGKNG